MNMVYGVGRDDLKNLPAFFYVGNIYPCIFSHSNQFY
jgi:hypothetical protein